MDVRHLAFIADQSPAAVTPREYFWGMPKRGLAFLLANVMFWQPLWAQADGIVVATPGTSLGQAGNGVPIVNIATPNGAGLSHNQFHDYNVGTQGVILNNGSTQTLPTQLGGIVVGNPHLKNSGLAQTILNEVVGGNPSQLRGYTEVAGQSARVIVANPYGISCNGCGFINTPRVTLTTGKPVLDGSGRVDRYQVDQGSVSIEGAGINATNIDRFEIITRSAKINAEIQANNLTIIAGRNDVNAESLSASARANDGSAKPELAIDSSALGGMYAGAIKLVGTEGGVGVKLAGNMAASGGDIQIDANGHLTLAQTSAVGAVNVKAASLDAQGPVYAGTALNVQTQGNLTSQKTLAARDSIALSSGGVLTNSGIIEAGVNADNSRNAAGDVSLNAQNLTNSKSVVASRNLTVNASQTLNNQNGTLSAGQIADITAGTLDNQNNGRVLSSGALNVTANQVLNTHGLINSTGDLTGTLGQLNNSNGEVSSAGITRLDAGGLDNRSGQVLGDLGLNIDLSGALDNRDGLLGSGKNVDLRAASLDNRDKGVLVSDAMLNARISGLLDNRNEGDISAKGAIELRSGNLDNRAGKVIGKHTLTISSDVADNSAGVIQADQHLKLQIGQMSNREKGLISGRADIAYDGLRMDNSGGLLSAFGPLKFNANEVQNLAGRISSQSDLTAVIGLLQQQGGALVAQGNLSLTGATLDNRNGGLVGTTKALTLKVDSVDNRAGEISANLMLNIAGKNLDNSDGGKVLTAGDLKLVVTNLVNQSRGQIVAKGATTVSGGTLDNSNGTLASLDGLVITLDEALINRQGLISSEGQLSADIGSLDNSAGTLTSAAGLSATSRGSLRNMGGSISTDSTLYLNSANLDNSQKGLISGNATATVVTGDFDNSQGGRLTGGATLSLTAKHVNNAAGRIASQNDLTASVSGLDQQGGELFSKTSLSLDLNHGQLNNQKGLINAPGLLLLKQLNSVNNEGGEISSAEAFTLAAQQLDNRNGKLLSNQDLTLRIARALNNVNGAISAASITSHSASLDNTDGLINSRGRLELSVDGSLNNQRGTVIADGDLVLTADSVDNRSGNIAGKADATVHATSLDNQTGQLITIGVLKLTADTLDNRQGGLLGATKAATLAVDQINNRGGEITTNADLLIVSKKLDNSEGGNVFSGTALTLTVDELINRNKALISAGAGMQLQGRALDNSGGSLLSSQNMQLTLSGVFTNEQGKVSSESALVVDTAQLINSRGSLSSAADLHIDSVGSLSNQGGAIVTDSALTLTSASLDNRAQGSISAKGAMNVTTGAFDNSQSGRLSGASTLDLTAGQVTNQDDGRIGSEGALTASVTGLDQQGGKLFSNTTLSLDLNQGQLNNQNGLINASGALLLKRLSGVNNQNGEISSTEAFELAALNLDNSGGKLLSNQGLTLRIAKALDNVKGLVGASTLDLNAATLNNSGGTLNSRGDLNLITSDGLRNDTQGLINAAQILNVSSADLDNRNGSLLGGTALILKAMALNNRDSGLINSQGNLSIIGTTLDSGNGGEVSATGDINLNLTALTQNGGRLLGSNAVTVDLGSGDFDNQNGVLVTKGPLTLNRLRDLHNQNGEISSDLSFNVIARALNNSAGKLISNQQLSITGTTMTNRNGLMSGWQGLAVNGGDFDNRDNGTLSSRSGDVAVGLGGVLLNGNAGALVSKGSLSVKAASLDNSNKGILSSGAGQTLVLNQALNNSQGGLIDSGTALVITAAEVTNVGGTINAQQAINTSATSLNNNGGQIAGNGALTLSLLGQLNNTAGKLVGTGPVLITGVSDLTNQNGQLASQSTLTLLTGSLDNSHSGTIAANDSLLINASGALANNDNGLIYSKTADMHLRAASVANGKGAIQGQNGLTLEIGGDLDNQSGNVIAENGMASIRAGNIDNRGGVLAAVRGTLNAHTVGVLRNGYDLNNNSQGGVIQGQGLTLSALAKLDNNGGRISAQAADASLVTGAFDNRNGVLSAKGLTAVTGSGLDNSTGQIAGNRIDLTLGDVLDNHNGIIESATNLTVSANSLDNQAGRLRSLANTGKTSFQIGGLLDNRNGVLETANTDLTLAVGNFLNAGGQLNHVGRGRFDIATANIVGAGGSITTGGLLELAADSWTNSSVIQAGRLSVNVNNFTQTTRGQLLASESFQARGDNWNNDGLIASDGRVDIQLSGVYGGNGRVSAIGGIGLSAAQVSLSTTSSIAGGGDSTIEVGGQLINAGRLTSNGGLSVVAGSIVNNGTLGAAQNLKLDTPSLLNDRGLIFSGADMALNVSNFTNQSADLYGLGNLTIGGYGGAARAASVENISGTLESAGNFTLLADLFKNRTSGAVASGGRKLVSGFIANVCADCKGGTFTFMLKAREIYESTDSDSGASAMLSAGKDFVFQGGTFLNSKSTVGAGGNITINADSLQNIGSTSGTIERTVTYSGSMGAGTTLGFLADVVTPYNQRNNPDFPYVYYIDRALEIRKAIPKSVFKKEPGREGESYKTVTLTDSETGAIVSGREGYAIALPGLSYGFETSTPSLFDSSNLSALPDELNQLTLVSDIEVVKDHTGAASTGTIRNAVIQAGGNVAITAQKDLQNSVIHEDYSAAAGTNRIADTRVTGTGATVIRINAQLPPDLAQQQVNPLSLPGFALPTGQNGLFRLSDQANSNLAPGAGGTPLPGWSVSAENVSTLQHVTNTTTSGPRSLTIDSAASFSSSDRTVDPVKRSPTSVASNASALDVSVASSSPAAGRVVTSPDALPVVRVTGLPDVKVPASSHKYLIETNPVLTELKSFMSSDYLLSNLGYDPDNSAKRLGDGLYEQRLIQQAVVARTGQRYIDGQTTDEGLFKYLMNNAIASKQTLNLAVGVSLTSEQVAALTHDIVWLEEHEVNGEKVLVPVLYLAQAEGRLGPTGALIAGRDVSLIAGQNLDNVGTLKASNNLSATAGNDLVNSGLLQAGNRLDVLAVNNVVNKSGGILAGRDVSVTALVGDVLNERTVTSQDSNTKFGTQHHDFADNAARIEAANDLRVLAGQDINIIGGELQSGRDMDLDAGRDLNVTATQIANSVVHSSKHNSSDITQLGSSLNAGRDLSAQAGRDLSVIASQIDAKRDIAMAATENLIISSAADEEHSLSKNKKVTRQEDHVSQVMSGVTAGGDVALTAGENLAVISSRITAGDEAYLVAGDRLDILAAQDTDYSLYDKKKKGSFGSLQTQHDEVTKNTHVGSEISSGGNLQLVSGGDQRYQVAKLDSGKDIVIDSGGSILFEGVKDLHDESHTKSDNDAFWNSSKGKGNTDETLRQTQMNAKGDIIIKAVDGLQIDIKEVNQQTVSQTIDAMVQADPQLAWLKEAEARGDVDWRQVKEIHESFKYSNSGLGPAAQLILAIAMAAIVGPAALSALSASMGAGWAAGFASVASSAATNAATSFINNGGDLGAVFQDVTSSDALKGYVISGVSAGLTTGYFNEWTGTTRNPLTGKITSPPLNTMTGVNQFAQNQLLQGGTSALLGKVLGQDVNMSDVMKTAVFNTLAAASFNAVGDYTVGIEDGSMRKIAIHAMVGGLLAEATGGDFRAGALAAGANEALINYLDTKLKGDDNLLTMSSQIVGVLTATTGKNVDAATMEKAAWVTKNASQYNRQLHREERELAKQLAARSNGRFTAEQIERQLRLSSVNGTEITHVTDMVASGAGIYDTGGNWIALGNGQYVQNFQPADREVIAYISSATDAYSWTVTAQTGFTSISDKADWSKTPNGPGTRDPLSGYPSDENGRYRVPVIIDGASYAPRYLPCANAECLATGANIDFGDSETLKWLRAADVKTVNDIGWIMGVAAIPAGGVTSAMLSNGSVAASLLSGYLKDETLSSLATNLLSDSFEMFAVRGGLSEEAASKLANGMGAAGVWDAIAGKSVDILEKEND